MSKMSDLHIELTMDTDPFARKVRIISKHLQAMADELELAAQLEESPSPEEPQVRDLCDHCGRPLGSTAWGKWCSAGCLEMAGMGPAKPHVECDYCGATLIKPYATMTDYFNVSHSFCDMVCLYKRLQRQLATPLVDAVILRLRDCFGMKIEG